MDENACTYGNGSLVCGECMCNEGRYGQKCECSGDVLENIGESEEGCRPWVVVLFSSRLSYTILEWLLRYSANNQNMFEYVLLFSIWYAHMARSALWFPSNWANKLQLILSLENDYINKFISLLNYLKFLGSCHYWIDSNVFWSGAYLQMCECVSRPYIAFSRIIHVHKLRTTSRFYEVQFSTRSKTEYSFNSVTIFVLIHNSELTETREGIETK